MNEKEEKKKILEISKGIGYKVGTYCNDEEIEVFEKFLEDYKYKSNLIEKQDKIIDLMAEYITSLDIDEDICMKNISNTDLCNEEYSMCKECVIEYFNQEIEKGE